MTNKLSQEHITHIARAQLNQLLLREGYTLVQRQKIGESMVSVVMDDNPFDYSAMVKMVFTIGGKTQRFNYEVGRQSPTALSQREGRATSLITEALESMDKLVWLTIAS